MTIHWCGTGLSAIPGLRRLIQNGRNVVVWNRTIEKAQDAVGDLNSDIRAFDMDALASALAPGDIAVSMLPGDLHVPVAKLCLEKGAHFVSSSYISPEMRALDEAFKDAGLSCVNEIGLDPGIDHLMAHWLVADYRASAGYDADNTLSFISYCGGVPKIANPFRYKFSWSPLGVLTALRSPSRSIKNGKPYDVARPWDAISSYDAPLQTTESFEVYPNRDSIPFMEDYAFDPDWNVDLFVRGTLRLNGWTEAWKDVFAEVETLQGSEGDARLKEMSDQFWRDNAYDEGEPDRVIMCVALKAEKDGTHVYHKTYVMDAWGDVRGTAMARLVSTPVSLAIDMIVDGQAKAGVTAATSDLATIDDWMGHVRELAQHVAVVDHLG
ncbi:saccharopine dehydrogenase family protein [Aliiroseovarius sp. 2305UL8-7]|uniref:saccharopine dehydrogenase family protein n=1 Tax=Aliiroseovarius conchicola TaxID=3121637 RepID=UPI003529D26F